MTQTGDPVPGTDRVDTSDALVGRFSYHPGQRRWLWSPEVYWIHGYPNASIVPTTDLILGHVLDEHRDRVTRVIERLLNAGEQFACPHTVVDRRGRHRRVVAVGVGVRREDAVVHRTGFLIDLTEAYTDEIRHEIDQQLAGIVAGRSMIDQARGVLMATYRIDADAAWELLRETSQRTNVKVRDIAVRLLTALGTGPSGDLAATREIVRAVVPAPPDFGGHCAVTNGGR